ncbi:MAG: TrmH family RNA methyltransferase [Planctomycetota bacterium]
MSATALDEIRVVLQRPHGTANVGGAARAMANFGLTRLVLVAPHEPPIHPDALSWASGASHVLERAATVPTLEEALAETVLAVATTARPRHLQARGDIRELAPRIVAATRSGPVAVVFGPERIGLSNDELALCQECAVIPAAPAHTSLNLAGAVLVVAHELFRAASSEPVGERLEYTSHDERCRLVARSLEILDLIGYMQLGKSRTARDTVQRLVLKGRLERRDARNLLAILRHIEWLVRGE